MSFVRNLHVFLAYATVAGFLLRAVWAYSGSPLLRAKPVRILPHVIDTVLLLCGLALVFGLGHSLGSAWLLAKLAALVAYIGFGVLTLRATSAGLRTLGVTGALVSIGYLFAVAHAQNAWPLPG